MTKKKGAQQGHKEVPVQDSQAPPVTSPESAVAWRERLDNERLKFERHLVEALENERQRSEREWRQAERSRIDEQERKFLEAIAFRQAKLESEWVLQRKTDSEGKALDWLRENQRLVSQELQQNMQKLRQDMEAREAAWQEQSTKRLIQLEGEWRDRFGRELQRLEVDWREQEVIHRESARFAELERELREKDRLASGQQMQQQRDELLALQKEALNGHLLAVAEAWSLVQEKWHQEWQLICQREQERSAQGVLQWQKQVEHDLGADLTEWKKQLVEQVAKQGRDWQQAQDRVIHQWLNANLTGWNEHVADIFKHWLTKEEEHIARQIAPLVEKALRSWQGRWHELEEQMKGQNEGRLNELARQIREDHKSSRTELLAELSGQVMTLGNEYNQKTRADLLAWEETSLNKLKSACAEYVTDQRADLLRQHQVEIELLGQDFRLDLGRLFESASLALSAKFEAEAENLSDVYREMFRAEQEGLRLESVEQLAARLTLTSSSWQEDTARLLQNLEGKFSQTIAGALHQLEAEVVTKQEHAYQALVERQSKAQEALAANLYHEFRARFESSVVGWNSQMETHFSTWRAVWDEERAEMNRQAALFREELKSTTTETMRGHETQIVSEINIKVQDVYARWLGAIEAKLGEVEQLLQSAISRRAAEMVAEIERAYLVRLDALKAEAHLDYRGRLGKLADELTARHKQELAALLEGRNEALKEHVAAEISRALRQDEQKSPAPDKVFVNNRQNSRRGR